MLQEVKPSINIKWETTRKYNIIDADFYLADILSRHNVTLKDKLYVLLKSDHYEFDKNIDEMGLLSTKSAFFKDEQKAHILFCNK